MFRFLKIAVFVLSVAFAQNASAQDGTATILHELDMGTIVLTNPASAYITGYGSYVTPKTGGLTIRGYTRGNASVTMTAKRLAGAGAIVPYIGGTRHANYYLTSLACENTDKTLSVSLQFKPFDGAAEIGVPNDTFYIGATVYSGSFSNFASYTGTCTASVSWTFGYVSGGSVHYVDDVTLPIRITFATDLPAITVSNRQDMNFGQVANSQAHNVTINPNGCTISSTVPSALVSTASAQCGIVRITNENSTSQAISSVTLPASITLSKEGGGGSMTLTLSSYPNVASITTIAGSSSTDVNVGGTLAVPQNIAAGSYSGNYTLTVNY